MPENRKEAIPIGFFKRAEPAAEPQPVQPVLTLDGLCRMGYQDGGEAAGKSLDG